jgi:hypothetical protein
LEALTETPNLHYATRSTYFALLSDGKAFVEFVLAFILSLGFQLTHKSTCNGGSGLTRHSQTPPDLVVKSQLVDIAELTL